MEKKTAGIWKNRDADHNIVYSANFSLIETDLELSISALLSWEVTLFILGLRITKRTNLVSLYTVGGA